MRRTLILSLLAIALSACSSTAPKPGATSTAPSAATGTSAGTAPAANAVDPTVIEALKRMGTYLASLDRYFVRVDLEGERVLADGQKLQHTATADVGVARPNKMRIRMRSARSDRDLFYDGKTVTLYVRQQGYYSQAPFNENIAGLVTRLKERFDIEIPVGDLFLWGSPQPPVEGIVSAMNAGQDIIDGERCDHYALRQGNVDWQIWISSSAQPLPRKLVITNRADEARPQSTSMLDWVLKPKFTDAIFTFTPPKDAKEAKFVPVKPQARQ